MKLPLDRFVFAFLLLAIPLTLVGSEPALHIGGTGGAYFLASPGELVIDLEKRDLHRSTRTTDLRAILVGPDRKVLRDVTIPDDGRKKGSGLGPVGRARLAVPVPRTGVYGLNVTVSNDRYGTEISWGFRTNCSKYLLETSRGHRDARHEEPIVLFDAGRARDLCFLPRSGPFRVEVNQPPFGDDLPMVYDSQDRLVATLDRSGEGSWAANIPAEPSRGSSPWRLQLPQGRAEVQIDGVTRWEQSDAYPDLSLWTPDRSSWFPLPAYRWLLTPYRRTVFGPAGSEGAFAFSVHNNSRQPQEIRLQLEYPGAHWDVRLATRHVKLKARQSRQVELRYTVPTRQQVVHIRVTPVSDPHFTTYSSLTVVPGLAPTASPLSLPLTLKPYEHENEQFGYLPDYPVASQVYFDPGNRPYVNMGSAFSTWRDGAWMVTPFRSAGKSYGAATSKLAFDLDGRVYLVGRSGREAAYLCSADRGATFTSSTVPIRKETSQSFDIEQFSGHNGSVDPPPFVRFTRTAVDPKRIWRRINDLELFVPEWRGDRLAIGDPILISKKCIGLSTHSGPPSSIVSRGSKVHVAWAEATDPAENVPGVPTYVVTYDRSSKTLGQPALIGYGAPPNDVHNTPSITMDSKGFLHVLAGTHGRPFQYARSLTPNDAGHGWTVAEPTGGKWRQTYIGLVCDTDDTLHLVSRVWRSGEPPHPSGLFATLAHQQKKDGQPWGPPRSLIVPPFSEYSVFYHRLTIDRRGRLFLSYDYWSTYWFYRTDHRGDRRALLMSPDMGTHWKLAERSDLIE